MTIVLGIDIGTSSCKVDLIKCQKGLHFKPNFRLDSISLKYQFLKKDSKSSRFEQSVEVIFQTLDQCLQKLDSKLLEKVKCIGICGQMHGCLLWKKTETNLYSYDFQSKSYKLNSNSISKLITWQDDRCDEKFLKSLPKPSLNSKIASGFGVATIFWFLKYQKEFLVDFDQSGTIMDFIIMVICNLDHPVQSVQNAYSYGYFDLLNKTWNVSKLKNNGFPLKLLPTVVNTGSIAGRLKNDWHSIKANVPVFTAFGDLQSHVFSCLENNFKTAVLNIGTSIQLSTIIQNDLTFENVKEDQKLIIPLSTPKTIDYVPYFNKNYLAVSSSLNGGNVLDLFVKYLKDLVCFLTETQINENYIWNKLTNLMNENLSYSKFHQNSHLYFDATLFGERFNPELKANLHNITSDLNLIELFYSINEGIIENIFKMMPIKWIVEQKIDHLIGVGSALHQNNFLKIALKEKLKKFKIKVDFIDQDAACGAALAAFSYFQE